MARPLNQKPKEAKIYESNQILKKIFLIISFLITILLVKPIAAHSFFHRQTKLIIKLADYQTLQQEWLVTQPQFIRHDIQVFSKESIPEILKYFDIETTITNLQKTSYNPYGFTFFKPKLKNPPQGLIGVYFKPRINPFKEKYPNEDDEYTLEDLLKYEIAIEEAFVFWDVKEKPPQEEQSQINLVVSKIFADQNK